MLKVVLTCLRLVKSKSLERGYTFLKSPRKRPGPRSTRAGAKKKNADLLFEVSMNKMSIRSTHGVMPSGHDISGVGLLTPLEVDTIVTKVSK